MVIYNILLMGISASLMYGFAQILYRRMHRKYARWYYIMLVTAMLMLIIPVQAITQIPKIMKITVPQSINNIVSYDVQYAAEAEGGVVNTAAAVLAVWALTAAVLMLRSMVKYFSVCRTLKRISAPAVSAEVLAACDEVKASMSIKRGISVRVSRDVESPLLFGIVHPAVIIPERSFTYKELVMIMAHELTHYRHRDLIVKLLTSAAVCIHWFNPVAYLLARSVNAACELCCDESVLDLLKLEDKKEYGRLIISVIESSVKRSCAFTTAMASPKREVQNRLIRIVEFRRPSKVIQTVCTMLLVSVFICSVTAFGIEFSKEIIPENVTSVIDEIVDTAPVFRPDLQPAPYVSDGNEQPEHRNTAVGGNEYYEKAGTRTAAAVSTASAAPEPTAVPQITDAPVQTDAPQKTAAPPETADGAESAETAKSPAPLRSAAPEKAAAAEKAQASQTPYVRREDENNTDAQSSSTVMIIHESANLNDETVTASNSKRIVVNSGDGELKKETNNEVTVYVRPNNDGSYDLLRYEKFE